MKLVKGVIISVEDENVTMNKDTFYEMDNNFDIILKENKKLKKDKKELIEFLKEYDKYRDSFKWNEQDYIDTIEKIKEILGDKE